MVIGGWYRSIVWIAVVFAVLAHVDFMLAHLTIIGLPFTSPDIRDLQAIAPPLTVTIVARRVVLTRSTSAFVDVHVAVTVQSFGRRAKQNVTFCLIL